jgi:hypothetical protein
MNHETPEHELQRRLRALSLPVEPNPELEQQIVNRLRERGDFRQRPPSASLRVAAMLVAVAAGSFGLGRFTAGPTAANGERVRDQHGKRFLLLLHGDPSYQQPQLERELYAQYAAWGGELAKAGKIVDAARLADPRPTLVREGEHVTTQLATPGVGLSGFFVIQTQDEAEAIALAAESPHLSHGGTIEVRQLVGEPR